MILLFCLHILKDLTFGNIQRAIEESFITDTGCANIIIHPIKFTLMGYLFVDFPICSLNPSKAIISPTAD